MAVLLLFPAALALSSGCGKSDKGDKPSAASKTDDHPEEGPHGGALVEWGDEKYHVEFTVSIPKKKVTVYILDGTAKKAAPIPAESIHLVVDTVKPALEMTLKADPQKDDPEGRSSRFVGEDERISSVKDFKGEISGTVEGTGYAGKLGEHDHKH